MAEGRKIEGSRIYLRALSAQDVSEDYVQWMNDGDIIRYLTSRQGGYSEPELKEYVDRMNASASDYLFGIFLKGSHTHIGNIKVGSIDALHKFADVGLIIGKKEEAGKGYGTEAIQLVTRYAFEQLHLNKLIAGMISENVGSYKAFVKAGYEEAGRLKRHVLFQGEYSDTILMEKCQDVSPAVQSHRVAAGQSI